MNKRINELFGQALDEAVPETWTTLDPTQLSKLKAKFAELIVRECAKVCNDVGTALWAEPKQSNMVTAQTCKVAIEKHFGVE